MPNTNCNRRLIYFTLRYTNEAYHQTKNKDQEFVLFSGCVSSFLIVVLLSTLTSLTPTLDQRPKSQRPSSCVATPSQRNAMVFNDRAIWSMQSPSALSRTLEQHNDPRISPPCKARNVRSACIYIITRIFSTNFVASYSPDWTVIQEQSAPEKKGVSQCGT